MVSSLPAQWKKRRDNLLVSWAAAQKATAAFEHAKRDSVEAWYDWHVQDELPKTFWGQHLTRVQSPMESTNVSVAVMPADFPWGIEHLSVASLEVQLRVNPQYDPLAQLPEANIIMDCRMQSCKVSHAWASRVMKPISSLHG